MHSFFGEESNAVADYYYPLYAAQMDRVGASRGWPPYQKNQFDFGRSKSGALIIGDANEAVDKILQMKELCNFTCSALCTNHFTKTRLCVLMLPLGAANIIHGHHFFEKILREGAIY